MASFKVVGKIKAPNWQGIGKAIEKTMEGPVAKRLPEYAENATSDWSHKPDFPAAVARSAGDIRVQSYPDGTNANNWIWLVLGTGLYGPKHRKYPIKPKRPGGVLAFPFYYSPHTTPAGGIHGPGATVKPTIFAKEVMHPGIKKRPLVKQWVDSASEWFFDMMRTAVTQAARRA